jgi:hypothetical protein
MHIWLWSFLALISVVGVLAVVSPRYFTALARGSSRWVDSSKFLAPLDKQVHIDAYFLPHSRLLGASVLGAVIVLAMLLIRR